MAKALDDQQVHAKLTTVPGWALEDGQLARSFAFGSYADGVAFAVKVAMLSEKLDHHPDALSITWKKVRVAYVTHSAGGITELDFDAASKVSGL
jgi:4a-hydroxytetrahydrobiopterin dehydratase